VVVFTGWAGADATVRQLVEAGFSGTLRTIEMERPLDAGVDINAFCSDHTVLLQAAKMGNIEVVQALLKRGAKVDLSVKNGYNALATAVSCRNSTLNSVSVVSAASIRAILRFTVPLKS
jgi:ankyrin repeat protein